MFGISFLHESYKLERFVVRALSKSLQMDCLMFSLQYAVMVKMDESSIKLVRGGKCLFWRWYQFSCGFTWLTVKKLTVSLAEHLLLWDPR